MNLHLCKTKCQNVAFFLVYSTLFRPFVGALFHVVSIQQILKYVSQNVFKGEVFYHLVFLEK